MLKLLVILESLELSLRLPGDEKELPRLDADDAVSLEVEDIMLSEFILSDVESDILGVILGLSLDGLSLVISLVEISDDLVSDESGVSLGDFSSSINIPLSSDESNKLSLSINITLSEDSVTSSILSSIISFSLVNSSISASCCVVSYSIAISFNCKNFSFGVANT